MLLIHTSFVCAVFCFPLNVYTNPSCGWTSRIKHIAAGVIIEKIEDVPCRLTLSSEDKNLQVVATFHNIMFRYICASEIQIFDGEEQIKNQVNTFCLTGNPKAFASRKNGLVLVLSNPHVQFSLNLTLLETRRSFSSPKGTIKSPRVSVLPGSFGRESTPNNFYGIYKIIQKLSVSIMLNITEFNRNGQLSCSKDYIRINSLETNEIRKFCGRQGQRRIMEIRSSELTVVYETSNDLRYKGFTMDFKACIEEVYAELSNSHYSFELPTYTRPHNTGQTTCALILYMPYFTQPFQVTIYGSSDVLCSSSSNLKISSDGEDVSNELREKCETPNIYFLSSKNITMIYTLRNNDSDKTLQGTFTVAHQSKTDNMTTFLTAIVSSKQPSKQNTRTSKNQSTTQPTLEKTVFNKERTLGLNAIIIITALLTFIVIVEGIFIVSALVFIYCWKRNKNGKRSMAPRQEHEDTVQNVLSTAQRREHEDTVQNVLSTAPEINTQISAENDIYDAMNVRRTHVFGEAHSNAYGTVRLSLPQDEYGITSRSGKEMTRNKTHANNSSSSGQVYAVASTSAWSKKNKKKAGTNVSEGEEMETT